ncbi:MAG: rod shape-determining protein RodA, partial [Proteobacteria bacterium SW_6_67_9]
MATPDPVAGSTQPGSPLTRALYALHLDPPLLLGIIALLGVGLMALYSAGGESLDLVLRQSLRVGVG